MKLDGSMIMRRRAPRLKPSTLELRTDPERRLAHGAGHLPGYAVGISAVARRCITSRLMIRHPSASSESNMNPMA